jgi:hypothetical protein
VHGWAWIRYGARLGVAVVPEMTPYEFSRELMSVLTILGSDNFYEQRWTAPAREMLTAITDDYVRVLYGPDELTEKDKVLTLRTFVQLRWRLKLLTIVMRIKNISNSRNIEQTNSKEIDGDKS